MLFPRSSSVVPSTDVSTAEDAHVLAFSSFANGVNSPSKALEQVQSDEFDHAIEGFDIVSDGKRKVVYFWADRKNGEVVGLSITETSHDGLTHVAQFDLPHPWLRLTDSYNPLPEIVENLRNTRTFSGAVKSLESLSGYGDLICRKFTPHEEYPKFSPQSAREDILAWLNKKGVSTEDWGTGATRSLDNLVKEVLSGEADLCFEDGRVYVSINAVLIDIRHVDDHNQEFQLIEDRQELSNGTVRQRRARGGLLGEKIYLGELPSRAATRGLREELKIEPVESPKQNRIARAIEECENYPGLLQRSVFYYFRYDLPAHQYRPQYVEITPDKKTIFTWKKISDNNPPPSWSEAESGPIYKIGA